MIRTVAVDTNVLSFIFKRDTRADLYRTHLDGALTIISFQTLAETHRWALERNWGEQRRRKMEEFLEGFVPAFCDQLTCAKWAEASASARRNGRPIDAADAWIAATALQYGVPLVTHNPTHFLGVDGLRIISELAP